MHEAVGELNGVGGSEQSEPSAQFCCEPKIAPKIKCVNEKVKVLVF